jgi:hypothetical protein
MKFDNPDRYSPGFKQVMRKARPGQHIGYHAGELAIDRQRDGELDQIARFVVALSEIGVARLYQKRIDGIMHYFVVLTEALSIRKDQSGTLQDAERLMEIV